MTLQKAIELNKDSEKSLRSHKFIDHADAIKLGIEALKFFIKHRQDRCATYPYLLPGEK